MPKISPQGVSLLLLLLAGILTPTAIHAEEQPTVRTITAFIPLDRPHYRNQIQETLVVLRQAKKRLEQAGYEVQTLRISTQPFPEYLRGLTKEETLAFFRAYDKLAQQEGFAAAIGPALLAPDSDTGEAELLTEILLSTRSLSGTVVVAGEDGVRWEAVRAAARVIQQLAAGSPQGMANFNFAATARVPPHAPFYPSSYQAGEQTRFGIGLQSANVVTEAFATAGSHGDARKALTAALGQHARQIEAVAREVERETGWTYAGMDLSPAPAGDVSIGRAVESLSGAKFGAPGTLSVAAIVTDALRAITVKQAGYSGFMIPVMEDTVLAQRWSEGTLTLHGLLSYSSVCAAGLDTVPLPGDVTVEQLERIIGDVASLAVKLRKPLSVRLMPVPGKQAGERTEFDSPFIVNVTLQPVP